MKRLCMGYDLRDPVNMSMLHARPGFKDMILEERLIQISADSVVWPTPTEVEALIDSVGNLLFNPFGLAMNIECLIEKCREVHVSVEKLNRVCLTSPEPKFVLYSKLFGSSFFRGAKVEEQLSSEGWRHLGFDVLDYCGVISGLTNCGDKSDLGDELRHYFGRRINDVGLFDSYEAAAEFAEYVGAKVSSHAPFTPVGVLVFGDLIIKA